MLCCRPWRFTARNIRMCMCGYIACFRGTCRGEILNLLWLDFGVVTFRPTDPNLAAVEFLKDELAFVVPRGHRLAKRKSVSVKDLGEEESICLHAYCGIAALPHLQVGASFLRGNRVPLRMDVELPTY